MTSLSLPGGSTAVKEENIEPVKTLKEVLEEREEQIKDIEQLEGITISNFNILYRFEANSVYRKTCGGFRRVAFIVIASVCIFRDLSTKLILILWRKGRGAIV